MIYFDLSKFSKTPFGRFKLKDENNNDIKNPHSGEGFRTILKDLLLRAKKESDQVTVDFNNIEYGIGSSFLEESFGGLVRIENFSAKELIEGNHPLLIIESEVSFYQLEINEYIKDADDLKK